jgi:3-dehydroquinate synthase
MSSADTVPAEHFRVRDEVALPKDGAVVEARAERKDVYTIQVVRSIKDMIERLVIVSNGYPLAIVTEKNVEALYAADVLHALSDASVPYSLRSIPPGETSKSLAQAERLYDWLADSSMGRLDCLVAFGGGVINDLGGYVAATYMRGVPYVNLPTTLLAQVDGAMGGKVATNHRTAKNLIGAFCQPAGVISNVSFLASLESRDLAAGLAESIKKAIIASPPYWQFIEGSADEIMDGDLDALEQLVRAAAKIKSALIERDPYEEDLRRPLNFGHTVGHPLETVTGYGPLRHGEAVAFGMVVESRIAANRGLLASEDLERIIALLARVGLPTCAAELPVSVDGAAMVEAMGKVRLIRGGSLRYVLPICLGESEIADDVTADELRAALAEAGVKLTRNRWPRRFWTRLVRHRPWRSRARRRLRG